MYSETLQTYIQLRPLISTPFPQLLPIGHFQLNVHFHHKLLSANNLIILAIKIGHHIFPLLTSQRLLIHHAKSSWLGKLTVSIISLSLIYKLMYNH